MNLDTAPAVATAALPPMPVPCLDPQPGLILLGRDERGRPHASAFSPDVAPAAERAASLMGFATLIIADEHRALASSLPKGRVFESGRAFVPFCSTQTFARLLEAAGLADTPLPARAAAKPAEPPPPPESSQGGGAPAGGAGGAAKLPFDWAEIGIGSLVLARGDDEDGYYAATVAATKADNHFVLTWRDYPDLPEFSRHRHALGLLHPGTPTKGK